VGPESSAIPDCFEPDLTIMRAKSLIAVLLLVGISDGMARQQHVDAPIAYTTERSTVLFMASDSTRPYLHLRFREPVYVQEEVGRFSRIRTFDGANGLVETDVLSDIWLRISKESQTLFVYSGQNLLERMPVDLGYNFFSDKVRRGSGAEPDHWRTPVGEFFIATKNASSSFYKALVLNYPNAEDAERGLRDSLITRSQFEEIVRAESEFRVPPMGTPLGGFIEIHGSGTGRKSNWTQGCIALENEQLDRIWALVTVGTPVLIEP